MTKPSLMAACLCSAAVTAVSPAFAQDKAPDTASAAKAPPADDAFTIGGSVRARYETYDNTFRPSGAQSADLLSFKTMIEAQYDAGPVRFGAHLIDARGYDADADTPLSTADVNALELVEAYVTGELGEIAGAGTSTELTAGRFLITLGSKRLVANPGFRNTANGFTGARLDWTGASGQSLTLFYTLPQQRLPSAKADLLDNKVEWDREGEELRFWGAFFSAPVAVGANLELYLYGLGEDDRSHKGTRNRNLITPGARIYSKSAPGKLDYELEGAYQFGTRRSSSAAGAPEVDVSAYTLAAALGYTFDSPIKPRLALLGNIASGDDPDSASYNRFDTLYGIRRGDWGPSSSLYGPLSRNNLRDLEVRAEIKPSKRVDAFLAASTVWLDTLTDSFAKTGIKDATGTSGRHAGAQIEGRVRYWIVPKRLQLDVGAAVLAKGEFLKSAPNVINTDDTHYLYTDLTFSF